MASNNDLSYAQYQSLNNQKRVETRGQKRNLEKIPEKVNIISTEPTVNPISNPSSKHLIGISNIGYNINPHQIYRDQSCSSILPCLNSLSLLRKKQRIAEKDKEREREKEKDKERLREKEREREKSMEREREKHFESYQYKEDSLNVSLTNSNIVNHSSSSINNSIINNTHNNSNYENSPSIDRNIHSNNHPQPNSKSFVQTLKPTQVELNKQSYDSGEDSNSGYLNGSTSLEDSLELHLHELKHLMKLSKKLNSSIHIDNAGSLNNDIHIFHHLDTTISKKALILEDKLRKSSETYYNIKNIVRCRSYDKV